MLLLPGTSVYIVIIKYFFLSFIVITSRKKEEVFVSNKQNKAPLSDIKLGNQMEKSEQKLLKEFPGKVKRTD